ncbi:MAG: hypothetical protein JWQ43_3837 [Glaciihabitans sp.]|nr:hypothetical protein [Glaciihabitans sp.]
MTPTTGQPPTPASGAPIDPDADIAPVTPAPVAAEIDARYGRTPRAKQRKRLFAFTAAGGFVVVLAAWLFWGGVIDGLETVDAQNTGHTILSDSEVEVTWQLTATPGQDVDCALQALNESFGIIGWKIVHIPGATERTQSLTEVVRTSEQSVTGLIYRCWLP